MEILSPHLVQNKVWRVVVRPLFVFLVVIGLARFFFDFGFTNQEANYFAALFFCLSVPAIWFIFPYSSMRYGLQILVFVVIGLFSLAASLHFLFSLLMLPDVLAKGYDSSAHAINITQTNENGVRNVTYQLDCGAMCSFVTYSLDEQTFLFGTLKYSIPHSQKDLPDNFTP
jgi:hypothetical protein